MNDPGGRRGNSGFRSRQSTLDGTGCHSIVPQLMYEPARFASIQDIRFRVVTEINIFCPLQEPVKVVGVYCILFFIGWEVEFPLDLLGYIRVI